MAPPRLPMLCSADAHQGVSGRDRSSIRNSVPLTTYRVLDRIAGPPSRCVIANQAQIGGDLEQVERRVGS